MPFDHEPLTPHELRDLQFAEIADLETPIDPNPAFYSEDEQGNIWPELDDLTLEALARAGHAHYWLILDDQEVAA